MREEQIALSKEQIQKLLPWFGYGPMRKSNIVFFGNEEGLGGLPIQAVPARCYVYGNDSNTWINSNNWHDGYWDETENEGQEKLRKKTIQIRSDDGLPTLVEQKTEHFPIIDFQSRVLLHLEQPFQDWFQKLSWYQTYDKQVLQKIKVKQKSLYNDQSLIKAALVDWRPLPRPTEACWPYIGIDQKQYEDAFSLKRRYYNTAKAYLEGRIYEYQLDLETRMLVDRVQLLRKVFTSFDFPLLIGCGAPLQKKKLLELIFKDHNISFQENQLSNGKKYYLSEVELENKKLTILLTVFFNHRKNCLQLNGLEELTKKVIQPIIEQNKSIKLS